MHGTVFRLQHFSHIWNYFILFSTCTPGSVITSCINMLYGPENEPNIVEYIINTKSKLTTFPPYLLYRVFVGCWWYFWNYKLNLIYARSPHRRVFNNGHVELSMDGHWILEIMTYLLYHQTLKGMQLQPHPTCWCCQWPENRTEQGALNREKSGKSLNLMNSVQIIAG